MLDIDVDDDDDDDGDDDDNDHNDDFFQVNSLLPRAHSVLHLTSHPVRPLARSAPQS